MDRQQTIDEITNLETTILQDEAKIQGFQNDLQSANFNRNAGGIVLFLGLIGLLFLVGLWPLWTFLVGVGALTYFNAKAKADIATACIDTAQKRKSETQVNMNRLKNNLLYNQIEPSPHPLPDTDPHKAA